MTLAHPELLREAGQLDPGGAKREWRAAQSEANFVGTVLY